MTRDELHATLDQTRHELATEHAEQQSSALRDDAEARRERIAAARAFITERVGSELLAALGPITFDGDRWSAAGVFLLFDAPWTIAEHRPQEIAISAPTARHSTFYHRFTNLVHPDNRRQFYRMVARWRESHEADWRTEREEQERHRVAVAEQDAIEAEVAAFVAEARRHPFTWPGGIQLYRVEYQTGTSHEGEPRHKHFWATSPTPDARGFYTRQGYDAPPILLGAHNYPLITRHLFRETAALPDELREAHYLTITGYHESYDHDRCHHLLTRDPAGSVRRLVDMQPVAWLRALLEA